LGRSVIPSIKKHFEILQSDITDDFIHLLFFWVMIRIELASYLIIVVMETISFPFEDTALSFNLLRHLQMHLTQYPGHESPRSYPISNL
jgi:hypothetical protein